MRHNLQRHTVVPFRATRRCQTRQIPQTALSRLLSLARSHEPQATPVADFLLSWYDAEKHGAWNPAEQLTLPPAIADDIARVLRQAKPTGDPDLEKQIEDVWFYHRFPGFGLE